MVRKRFGGAIRQAALETLVQDAYKQVLEQEKLVDRSAALGEVAFARLREIKSP